MSPNMGKSNNVRQKTDEVVWGIDNFLRKSDPNFLHFKMLTRNLRKCIADERRSVGALLSNRDKVLHNFESRDEGQVATVKGLQSELQNVKIEKDELQREFDVLKRQVKNGTVQLKFSVRFGKWAKV